MSDKFSGDQHPPSDEAERRDALEEQLAALDVEARELSEHAVISPGMDGHLSAQLDDLDARRDALRRRLDLPTSSRPRGSVWGWIALVGFAVALMVVLGLLA